MPTTFVAPATTREPAQFASGVIEVTLSATDYVILDHRLGRRCSYVVVGATGPVQVWEVPVGDPYNKLGLQANVPMTVRICLV